MSTQSLPAKGPPSLGATAPNRAEPLLLGICQEFRGIPSLPVPKAGKALQRPRSFSTRREKPRSPTPNPLRAHRIAPANSHLKHPEVPGEVRGRSRVRNGYAPQGSRKPSPDAQSTGLAREPPPGIRAPENTHHSRSLGKYPVISGTYEGNATHNMSPSLPKSLTLGAFERAEPIVSLPPQSLTSLYSRIHG